MLADWTRLGRPGKNTVPAFRVRIEGTFVGFIEGYAAVKLYSKFYFDMNFYTITNPNLKKGRNDAHLLGDRVVREPGVFGSSNWSHII